MVGKSAAAFGIVLALRYSMRTALVVAAGLAQIGELSFILVGTAISVRLIPPAGRDLVLAGALVSITLNPLMWRFVNARAATEPTLEPAPSEAG
jgi:CPA2 family monovalent cation:H+ antiporter-2